VGEKVVAKTHVRQNIFSDKYEGSHTVLKKINSVTCLFEIDKNGKKQCEKNIFNK